MQEIEAKLTKIAILTNQPAHTGVGRYSIELYNELCSLTDDVAFINVYRNTLGNRLSAFGCGSCIGGTRRNCVSTTNAAGSSDPIRQPPSTANPTQPGSTGNTPDPIGGSNSYLGGAFRIARGLRAL
jgi:hypothetical protein